MSIAKSIFWGVIVGLAPTFALASCATHCQAQMGLSRRMTEPVGVPKHMEFRGDAQRWAWLRPLVPTRGTMLTPPSVQPVPPPDAPGAERRPGEHFYFDGDIDFSDPQPRVDEETVKAQREGEKKPEVPDLLGMLLGKWGWVLGGMVLAVVALLIGFRARATGRRSRSNPTAKSS